MAPAFTQSLPVLSGTPNSYSHELRAELLYELCAALVREGWGTPEIWTKCEESAVLFAQRAIMEAIGEERWNLLQRNVEYHLNVSDVAEEDGADMALGNGRLAVTIECGGSGFLKIGPAIETLEEEASGLGAAFYWTLTNAIYRVMRIYNHDDAFEYEERMKEYAEEEDNPEQYGFPEVENALPESIRRTLKENPVSTQSGRASFSHGIAMAGTGHGSSSCGASNDCHASGLPPIPVSEKTAGATRSRCLHWSWRSGNTTRSWPVSTRRANPCLKEPRSRHSESSSLLENPVKCAARSVR